MQQQQLIEAFHKIQKKHNPHVSPSDKIFNIDNDRLYMVKYKSKTYALMNPRVIDDELIVDLIREVAT